MDSIKTPESTVELFHNPNTKEIKDSTSRFNDTRAIVHGSNIITWNADSLLHHHVRHHTGIQDGIDAIIDHSKKNIQLFGDPEPTREKFKEYENTPHYKKHFGSYKISL
jgi:hydroxylamine reductase (hybrid-cluster protein)